MVGLRATKGVILFLILSTTFFFTHSVSASDNIVKTLEATYKRVKDLQADFSQTTHYEGFDTVTRTQGTFFFKPGKIRWDYLPATPQQGGRPQQIFVDGDTVFYVMPEQHQVIRGKWSEESELPINLFFNTAHLQDHFQISTSSQRLPPPSTQLLLLPKAQNSPLKKITLTLIPAPDMAGMLIQAVFLLDKNGNTTSFSFEKIRINKGLSQDIFTLKIHEGSEIIEMP